MYFIYYYFVSSKANQNIYYLPKRDTFAVTNNVRMYSMMMQGNISKEIGKYS